MEEKYVSTTKKQDNSSVVAAFFLGIAFSLFIVFYWILIQDKVIFTFVAVTTFVIFLTITLMFARPRSINKVVHISKPQEIRKEREFIGSTQTKTFHKNSCRLAQTIKPEFKVSSDDKNFFKDYKACKICMKK